TGDRGHRRSHGGVLLGVLAHEPHAPRAPLGIDLLRPAVYPLGLKQQRQQTRDGSGCCGSVDGTSCGAAPRAACGGEGGAAPDGAGGAVVSSSLGSGSSVSGEGVVPLFWPVSPLPFSVEPLSESVPSSEPGPL